MAPTRTPTGFFERALDRPRRRPQVSQPIDEAGEDLSDSPRSRYAEAGELASGGWFPREWGYGVGVHRDEYDYTTEHAAIIRAIARFGLHEQPPTPPWPTERPIDEFDFAAYPRGVRTWTEDHPAWWQRSRRVR